MTGLKHQTPRIVGGDIDGLSDGDVAQTREFAKHKRRALAFGQGEDVSSQLGDVLTGFDLLGHRAVPGRIDIGERHRGGGACPDEADGAVVDDAVKPRAHRKIASAGSQRLIGVHHRVLKRLLRILGVSQDGQAVAIKVIAVALVDDLERTGVSGRDKPRERGVGEHLKGARPGGGGGWLGWHKRLRMRQTDSKPTLRKMRATVNGPLQQKLAQIRRVAAFGRAGTSLGRGALPGMIGRTCPCRRGGRVVRGAEIVGLAGPQVGRCPRG